MRVMNIAFVGLRHDHIFALYKQAQCNPFFHICGAFEPNEEARTYAEKKGVACCYESLDQVLNDPFVDAVALGGVFGERGAVALAALKSGKHVIADKPLCIRREELDAIENAAKQYGKTVSCMFTMRFEPKIRAAKKLVESGALGEINNVYFGGQHPLRYGRRPSWYFEEGAHGGVINDIAIHGIDVLSYALGLEVNRICAARCWNRFAEGEPDFKDSAQCMLTAQNGAGILADVSYAIPDGVEFELPYYWQFVVWGTNGVLRFSLGSDHAEYYVKGHTEPFALQEEPVEADYMTDFHHMVYGHTDTVLPMTDVFRATSMAIRIQESADKSGGSI